VSEHRGRVRAEKLNERNEPCMGGGPCEKALRLRGVHVHSGEEALTQ
jgi:hypothetical protein